MFSYTVNLSQRLLPRVGQVSIDICIVVSIDICIVVSIDICIVVKTCYILN